MTLLLPSLPLTAAVPVGVEKVVAAKAKLSEVPQAVTFGVVHRSKPERMPISAVA